MTHFQGPEMAKALAELSKSLQAICDFSQTASPFTQLTSTLRRFEWTPEANSPFYKLKELFTTAPILSHTNQQLILCMDASGSEVGAVPSQCSEMDDKVHTSLRLILPSPLTFHDKL